MEVPPERWIGPRAQALQPGVGDTADCSLYPSFIGTLCQAGHFTILFHFPATTWYGYCYLHYIKTYFMAQKVKEQFLKLLLC